MLYKGKKNNSTGAIFIEQAEEGKSIAMFQTPAIRPYN